MKLQTIPRNPLTIALTAVISGIISSPTYAQSNEGESDWVSESLPVVRVSAIALGEDPAKIANPYKIVDLDKLLSGGQSTIGDALNGLPGVNSDSFGGGASRPVIRGQSAPRVKMLSDGSSVLDASEISPDHATTVDPLLARRVEVLLGPSTLLYGSGAIGGVVNVLDNKIPEKLPEGGIDASVAARINSVASERAAAVELNAQLGSNFVLHLESSTRRAHDYKVPDWRESRVDGSFAGAENSSVGFSWVTPNGYVGLAYSYRNDDYGLPGHNHDYETCHPHGASLHCGAHDDDDHDHDHGEEHGHEMPPTVDLRSRRVDLRGEYRDPFAGVSRVRFRANNTDYQHHEIEHDEIATTFRNKGYESRVEIEHVPLGNWTGVIGLQHSDTRFSADGAEAFMPTVDSRNTGLFLVEHYQLNDQWHFELGARHEWQTHAPKNDARLRPSFDRSASSFSGAAIWEFAPDYSVTLSLARSERLPHAQELYARGIHLATNTYECGLLPSTFTCGGAINDKSSIRKEVSNNADLKLSKTLGDLTFSIGGFVNRTDNYIYARTLDQFEDFRLIKYSQHDARFHGFEAEATWHIDDAFSVTLFGDSVQARLSEDADNLPRIPSSRIGTRLSSTWDALSAELEFYRAARQERIADFETPSPAYKMLNLSLSYVLDDEGKSSVFIRGNNLLNEQIWNHSSFLANAIPLPGRNISAGFRYAF
jgi:iron complex outermembrane receptor protein